MGRGIGYPLTRLGGLHGGGRSSSAQPLLSLSAGVLSRASEASYYTTASALAWAAADTLRVDTGLFGESLYMLEGTRTNLAIQSESFAGWTATAGAVVTTNATTAPDGDADASNIFTNATNSRVMLTVTIVASTLVSLSRWVKNNSGDGLSRLQLVQRDGASTVDLASTAASTWVREALRSADVGVGGSNPQYWHRGAASAGSRDVYTWGAQIEVGRYETSYIRTAGGGLARAVDVWTWLAAEVPLALREAAWRVRAAPEWIHSELAASDERWLISFGGSSDGLRIRNDAGTIKLEAVDGGSVVASKTIASITRFAPVWAAVDPVAGTVSWDGVAGAAGTPWAWPGGVAARLGGVFGANSEWDGGLGLPVAL